MSFLLSCNVCRIFYFFCLHAEEYLDISFVLSVFCIFLLILPPSRVTDLFTRALIKIVMKRMDFLLIAM